MLKKTTKMVDNFRYFLIHFGDKLFFDGFRNFLRKIPLDPQKCQQINFWWISELFSKNPPGPQKCQQMIFWRISELF